MNISQTSHRLTALHTASALPDAHQEPGQTRPSVTPTESSQVALSAASRKLFELQQQDDHHADVDMARVHALRAAIAAGTLPVDAGRIADGLIGSACELLQPKV